MSPRGRRPSGADARGDILVAARRAFAEKGYQAASLRGVAREAGVDPALVHHYFSGKPDLFFHAVIGDVEEQGAAPVDPEAIIRGIIDGPADTVARRWTLAFLQLWDRASAGERLVSMLGAVAAGDEVREPVLQFLQQEVFRPIVGAVAPDHPELRANLAAAHVMGLAVGRYLARLPGLVELTPEQVADLTAPNLQHLLIGDLGAGTPTAR